MAITELAFSKKLGEKSIFTRPTESVTKCWGRRRRREK